MREKSTNLCRMCFLEIVETEQYYFLNNDNDLMLQSKLLDFLPEIDLSITLNPISCSRCMFMIEEIHKFKQLCIQTETNIRELQKQEAVKEEIFDTIKIELPDLQIINDEEVDTKVYVDIAEDSQTELYYCNNCNFNTNKKTKLIQHLNYRNPKSHMHKHTNKQPYTCDKCSYKTFKKTWMTNHKRTHTGEKPFKCNVCDYCCNQISNLKKHMCKHVSEKPFKCNICDYCSNRKDHLKSHMLKHTSEKPFKCNMCDYCSHRKDHLKTHMLKHSSEKPFKCNICNYSSSQLGHLKRHMFRHTGEKPFKCNICDYRSIRMDQLKMHTCRREKTEIQCD